MTSDPLRRLTAGLAEEERIARGTFEPDIDGQDRWQLDGANVWTEESTPKLVVKHAWPNEARHIALQDPKATLDRVEAIRKVLDLLQDVDADIVDEIVETLASTYPEDTTEPEGTQTNGIG